MICFQLLVSLVFWTTKTKWLWLTRKMWFAFNYWYLWYSEQQTYGLYKGGYCCDLLSIIGIFGILNNLILITLLISFVVICFQLLVSLVFWTTLLPLSLCLRWLWFAFNYWYLWYSEQLNSGCGKLKDSCDLLSIIGIFGILNNFR